MSLSCRHMISFREANEYFLFKMTIRTIFRSYIYYWDKLRTFRQIGECNTTSTFKKWGVTCLTRALIALFIGSRSPFLSTFTISRKYSSSLGLWDGRSPENIAMWVESMFSTEMCMECLYASTCAQNSFMNFCVHINFNELHHYSAPHTWQHTLKH